MPKLYDVVTKSKTADGIALIRIDCPPDVFDVDGAYIMRRKRVAVYKMDAMRNFKPGQEEQMYEIFADLIPQWNGIVDVETGEPLANLEDEPTGLTKLDNEQLQWLTKMLQASPLAVAERTPHPKYGANGQT